MRRCPHASRTLGALALLAVANPGVARGQPPQAAPPDEPIASEPAPQPVVPPPPIIRRPEAAADAPAGSRARVPDDSSPRAVSYGGEAPEETANLSFEYSGYFRAPVRFGLARRVDATTDQSVTSIEQIRVPDNQYQDWQYTRNNQGPWAEMFFGMGNKWVTGTLALQAFSFTDTSFTDRDDQGAQLGIGQGWLEVRPELGQLNFWAKVGSHWNRYGQAGKYDAGQYDTFAFGRTHVAGYTVHGDMDFDRHKLWLEHGFGAKQPDPSPYLNTKFTLLHHWHAGWIFDEWLSVGVHFLSAFAREPDHLCALPEPSSNDAPIGACEFLLDPALRDLGDGTMNVYGFEARLQTQSYGELYGAYSRVTGHNSTSVGGAIEVIHAPGGGSFNGIADQYFNLRGNAGPGNGSIDTLIGQYDVSIARLVGPGVFGGVNLDASFFAMFNRVDSDDDDEADVSKLKWGTDWVYGPWPWFAAGVRFDRVQPNHGIKQQSFSVISPRVIFRSDWASHEEIVVGYAYYAYAERQCQSLADDRCVQRPNGAVYPDGLGAHAGDTAATQPATSRGAPNDIKDGNPNDPADGTYFFTPHRHTFRIEATMWW